MSRLRLDRSRYHSTVHGERAPNDPMARVHYYQNGVPFDAAGEVVEEATNMERPPRPRAASVPVRENDGIDPGGALAEIATELLSKPDDEPPAVAEGNVNLELWLTGERKYLFDQVQAAIRARYARTFGTVVDAVEFLVLDQSLVNPKKVSKKLWPQGGA